MDDNARWMAAGLFSPSKARRQEAQAKDWLYVDEWLRQQYAPRRAPMFERNDDTLQALMSLVAANERANEQQGLVDGLEQAALDEAKETQVDGQFDAIYEAIETSMISDAAAAVDLLANTAILLNSVTTQPMVIAADLVNMTNRHFALSQQLARTEALRKTIVSERANIQQLLKEVTGPSFVAPPDLQDKIAEWTRGTKHLKSKLNEYNDRLAASQLEVPRPDIDAVETQRADTERLRSEVAGLNEKLSIFEGLPSTPADAQAKVEYAKVHLTALVAERDDLFQGLVQSRPCLLSAVCVLPIRLGRNHNHVFYHARHFPTQASKLVEARNRDAPILVCLRRKIRVGGPRAPVDRVTLRFGNDGQGRLLSLPTDDDNDSPALQSLLGVVGESHKKALQLAPRDFATSFEPYSTGIIDIINQELLKTDSFNHKRPIKAELYSLNVYNAPTDHLKFEVKASKKQIGWLVVALPTKLEGGTLSLHKDGKHARFDWSVASEWAIQWAAFHSDSEHEVHQVTAGHCLTLTYKLFWMPREDLEFGMKMALGDGRFLNDGGTFGIHLQHNYPRNPRISLEGVDEAIYDTTTGLYVETTIVAASDVDEILAERAQDFMLGQDHVWLNKPKRFSKHENQSLTDSDDTSAVIIVEVPSYEKRCDGGWDEFYDEDG